MDFNQFGDCEWAKLRPGNVHGAHDWEEALKPIVARYQRAGVRRYFRADAAGHDRVIVCVPRKGVQSSVARTERSVNASGLK